MSSFRRYTNLAATLHLLRNKCITLLNPATWDDRNDAYFMASYKSLKNAETVLALCFAECSETYHHWHVFSSGSDGVCIEFYKDQLLSTFGNDPKVRTGPVKYKLLKDVQIMETVHIEEIPFLKRYPYQDEQEYRVVYVDEDKGPEYRDYPIDLAWIQRITLSPWMPRALTGSVKEALRSIEGCSDLAISRSTLIENDVWKDLTTRVRQ